MIPVVECTCLASGSGLLAHPSVGPSEAVLPPLLRPPRPACVLTAEPACLPSGLPSMPSPLPVNYKCTHVPTPYLSYLLSHCVCIHICSHSLITGSLHAISTLFSLLLFYMPSIFSLQWYFMCHPYSLIFPGILHATPILSSLPVFNMPSSYSALLCIIVFYIFWVCL